MTDNEKRAHDLAIAISVPKCMEEEKESRMNKKDITVDYFSAYINTYESALEALNKKYPNQ